MTNQTITSETIVLGYGFKSTQGLTFPCDTEQTALDMVRNHPHLTAYRLEVGGMVDLNADGSEDETPAEVAAAAPGEFVTTPANDRGTKFDVWVDRDIAGVIFDLGKDGNPATRFDTWSPKASNRHGSVGAFATKEEAEQAIRKLYPAPAGRSYTVIYTDNRGPVVHATGCSHNVRDSIAGVYRSEEITGSLEDVAAQVFEDILDEDGGLKSADLVDDLAVKPCARS